MNTALPDVNVLVARIDPTHVHHQRAREWFHSHLPNSWATCPITENAVLRILGNPRLPNSAGDPARAGALLRVIRAVSGHVFWGDDLSLLETPGVHLNRLTSHNQVTDLYLLALARKHDGVLVTFDKHIDPNALENGREHLLVL